MTIFAVPIRKMVSGRLSGFRLKAEKSSGVWQIWRGSIKKEGWKPLITEPGAAPQVKSHTSLNHRAINHQKHKTASDGCSPVPINALFSTDSFRIGESSDESSLNELLIRYDSIFQKTHPMTTRHVIDDATQNLIKSIASVWYKNVCPELP